MKLNPTRRKAAMIFWFFWAIVNAVAAGASLKQGWYWASFFEFLCMGLAFAIFELWRREIHPDASR